MLFSIIIPVYNVAEYLERCMDSVTRQTFTDIEIILVDDGSTDSSGQLCDLSSERDSRIVVIHKENGGLSDARNVGIQAAHGDYIIFVDSDDYIEIDTCEKISKFCNSNIDIITVNGLVEGKTSGIIGLTHISTQYGVLTGEKYLYYSIKDKHSPMAAWLCIIRRQFLIENNLLFKKGILHEDEQFTPRAMLLARRVVSSGYYTYHYIIRENSITQKKDKTKNAKDIIETIDELLKTYNGVKNKKLRRYLKDYLVNLYLSMYISANMISKGEEFNRKDIVVNNAWRVKTRLKSIIFCVSPKLYLMIHGISRGM